MFSSRTLLSAFLALSLSLLAACSSAPQVTDPIDDLAALADANGDVEATLNIVSVVASGTPPTAQVMGSDVTSQIVFHTITWTYLGKTGKGFSLSSSTPGSQVSAALASGDRVTIRGRVRKVGNVPAFVGLMHSQPSQATAVGAAAATPPTPVILLAEGKSLLTSTQSAITLTDLLVSSYVIEINGQMAGWLRTPNGNVISFQITSPRDTASGLPTGKVIQAKLSGQIAVVQTPLGVSGVLTGVLTFGQNKTVEVQGIAAATEVAAKD